MEKNPYEKNKYVEKHQRLNIPQDEIERKWRLYEEEEQMKILMGMSAPGNAWAIPFISTWKTDNTSTGSSNSNQVRLPLMPNGSYNFYVNWGDGTVSSIAAWDQPEATHTYAAVGTYTISITGYINGWSFAAISPATGATGDRLKLLTITQWGCLWFNSIITDPLVNSGAFYNCTNLTLLTVSDTPNFTGSPSTFNFFRGCTALTTINNINSWDVSVVTYFRGMFRECTNFNDNVGNWNVGNATSLAIMFFGSTGSTIGGKFTNGGSPSIGNWNTSNVTDMNSMFTYQPLFNQDIGKWDVSKVTNMQFMFFGLSVAPFGTFDNAGSDSIGNWNTGSVTNMAQVFQHQALFNRNIGGWNTSKATTMSAMFYMPATSSASLGVFNNGGSPSINNWDTSNVTNMSIMFTGQRFFNQPVGNWNTSKVTSMATMFYGSNVSGYPGAFNQDISNWNTGAVTTMAQMFYHQPNFNQNIGNWDVSKVTTFSVMFSTFAAALGAFNNGGSSSINNWNTALVTTMVQMFQNQTGFNQPIGNWNVSLVTNFSNFMLGKTNLNYSAANYDALLIGWASRSVKPSISINFGTIKYTAAATAARAILTSAPNNWTIVDGGI
jgi:surface protein